MSKSGWCSCLPPSDVLMDCVYPGSHPRLAPPLLAARAIAFQVFLALPFVYELR